MKKRALSFLLALLLVVSILPGFASAAGEVKHPVSVRRAELKAAGTIELDLTQHLVQAGGTAELMAPAESSEEEKATICSLIISALTARETEIDLTEYEVLYDNFVVYYAGVINSHPEFFYVQSNCSCSISTDREGNRYVMVARPIYKSDYTPADSEAFVGVCQTILEGMPNGTDEEKLLYFHDWIVTHCQYDFTYSKYDAYNCLVEGSAVCQGYSLAFIYLCSLADMEVLFVSSDSLGHAWNTVTLKDPSINDAYYYIDCTWDDPTHNGHPQGESLCTHTNFLRCKEKFITECGHYDKSTNTDYKDWVNGEGESVYNWTTTEKYEYYWWKSLIRPVQWVGTLMCYAKPTDNSHVYFRKSGATTETAVEIQGDTAMWYVFGSTTSYYPVSNTNTSPKSFITIASANGSFYYSTSTEIYKLTTDKQITKVYTLTAEEKAKGYIYGLRAEGNSLIYYLAEDPNSESVATGTLSLGQTKPGAISSVTAKAEAGKTTVTWTASANAATYVIQRRVKDTTNWTTLKSNATGLSYVDTTGVAGTVYQYRVRGRNDAGDGSYKTSSTVTALAASTKPGAISSVTAKAEAGKTTVTWTASSGATAYIIQRRVKDTTDWTTLKSNVTGLSYTDTTGVAGTVYQYRVRGRDGTNYGPFKVSSVVRAQAGSTSSTPGAISSVTATATAAGKTTVTWTASSGATAYIIQRRVKDTTTWTTLKSNVTGTSYIDTTGVAGTVYQYRVRGRDGTNYGPFKVSSVVRAK